MLNSLMFCDDLHWPDSLGSPICRALTVRLNENAHFGRNSKTHIAWRRGECLVSHLSLLWSVVMW